jgi:hypothetical protein
MASPWSGQAENTAGSAIRDAPEETEGPMYIHFGSNTTWLSMAILMSLIGGVGEQLLGVGR